jgi:SAM-dependent methyltransferase
MIQSFGKREKTYIPLSNIENDVKLARERFEAGLFNEAFDIYEQLSVAYPHAAVDILAELYDRYQQIPNRNRYTLYQSRLYNFSISPGDKVLDVGSGHIPFPLATHLADISITDHGVGRAGAPFKFVGDKPVYECCVESMPFKDKEFDFVYCSHVLEHSPDPGKACRELMRIARRGYIETPTKGKDIFLNGAKISNHTQYVECINNCLVFTEYLPHEIEGFQCSILQDMHSMPQSKREKAFSALIYLKAELVNTMFLWEDSFEFKTVKRVQPNGMSTKRSPNGSNAILVENGRDREQKKPLKFVQIHNFYSAYLDGFYRMRPTATSLPFKEQVNALISDGFSGVHMFAPYMGRLGYDSQLIIANNPYAQMAWLREAGQVLADQSNWEFEILRKQIDTIKPDILYISHPINYDSRFIRSLNHKPSLILGWRASMIPEGTDWSEFDVMLSSLSALRDMALKIGAKASEHFFPGYPTWINDQLVDVSPEYDVVFPGSWSTGLHSGRNNILRRVAEEAGNPVQGFTCGFYLSGDMNSIPPEVARFNLGGRFGIEMHRALKSGKIALDARGILFMHDSAKKTTTDLAGRETGNMRLFEVTGAGVFLLAEHFDNLKEYFELGKEIETFQNQQELIDKIRYYLAHPSEREEIARNGQRRCLEQYSISKRAEEMHRIIHKYLAKGQAPGSYQAEPVAVLKDRARKSLEEDKVQDAFQILIKAKARKEPAESLDLLRAHCFIRMNMPDAATQALLEELRYFPNNQEARTLLNSMQSSQRYHSVGMINVDEFQTILAKIRPYTMLGEARLYNLYRLARYVCENDIPGNFVECGVAAGGSSALLAYVIKTYSKSQRCLYAFDSFDGMPEPTACDTVRGIDAESTGWGTGTCAAPEMSVRLAAMELGVLPYVKPIKGYFETTLPAMKQYIGQIAFMHMDADWYESIKTILENLFDSLAEDALIQLDDYGYWDGCAKALHEFEAKYTTNFQINQIDGNAVWFKKPCSSNR